MKYFVKKTNELTNKEILQITELFNYIFERKVSVHHMRMQYTSNSFGYSYHSMALEGEKLVAHHAAVPQWFWYKGRKMKFARGGDTMIAKPYRDFITFYDVMMNANKSLEDDGFVLGYGYPNDKSLPVCLKGKIARYIGKLNIYCMPYRIGGVKPMLSWLNWLSEVMAWLWLYTCSLFASKKIADFPIHKEEVDYNQHRYQAKERNYGHEEWEGGEMYFRILEHDGVRTAFMIDIMPKSPRNFVSGVKRLIKQHSSEFDLILYPGVLPFKFTGMIKLPRKLEPKNFNMTGKIIDKNAIDVIVAFDIKNWDTNLSNYDLI
jgi:hypothetical protein